MNDEKGFTLIELLLVVMIIGFMLAVILPRGLRATTDAKYNLVRQNASELASFANDWVEQQILAQDEISTATRADYLETLVMFSNARWIAAGGIFGAPNNWNNGTGQIPVAGRYMNGVGCPSTPPFFGCTPPENSIEDIIDPAKMLRNPFNGASVFLSPNSPVTPGNTGPIPGAIASTRAIDSSTGGSFMYYSLIFQGTDSTNSGFGLIPAALADYHGGMAAGGLGGTAAELAGVREGVFFTKVRM